MLNLFCSLIFASIDENETIKLPSSDVKFLYSRTNNFATTIYEKLKEQILELGPEENFKVWGPSDLAEHKVTELEIEREFSRNNYNTVVFLINADLIGTLFEFTEKLLEQESIRKIIIIINKCIWKEWSTLSTHLLSDSTIILSDLSQTNLYNLYCQKKIGKEIYIDYAVATILDILKNHRKH
jgi:hypothetical protein